MFIQVKWIYGAIAFVLVIIAFLFSQIHYGGASIHDRLFWLVTMPVSLVFGLFSAWIYWLIGSDEDK